MTPNEFSDFPYFPKYVDIRGTRVAYVESGSGSAECILLLHGIPTWSYLYRKVIAALPGYHCVAPDFPGFGRSSRANDPSEYDIQWYVDVLAEFVRQLDLSSITIVVHDLGGPIGLSYLVDFPDRVGRVVILNTTCFADSPLNWRVRISLHYPIGELCFKYMNLLVNRWIPAEVHRASTVLTNDVMEAYRAPFRTVKDREIIVHASRLIPTGPTHPMVSRVRRTQLGLSLLDQPSLVIWGDQDRVLRPWRAEKFRQVLKNCTRVVHFIDSGHYLQEDKPVEIAEHIDNFIRHTDILDTSDSSADELDRNA